jgi:hypothetical protein
MRYWEPDENITKEWVSPEKMVNGVLFLAAQDASGVTGTVSTDEELSKWHGL